MISKNKIQAFTLTEMIVVIILTIIVAGLAFSILSLVQKQMFGIQKNFNKSTEINLLETSLWIDFNRYSKVEFNSLENELKFSSQIDSVTYKFTEAYIVKDVDTFQLQLQNKWMYFNGELIGNGQIDAVKLETTKAFQNQQLFIFKANDATAFMN